MFAVSSGKIATYPKITILLGLIAVGCFAVGFAWLKPENRTVKLFVPQQSQSMKDLDKAEQYFKFKMREENIILVPKPSKSLLSQQCLTEALEIHRVVTKLPHYSDLCATLTERKSNSTTQTDCISINPLELFNFEEKNMVDISSTLTKASFCPSSVIMSNGRPSCQNINQMFGSQTRSIATSAITNVAAMRMVYYLRDAETDKEYNEVVTWEKEFITRVSSLQGNMTCVKILYAAERSLDDAIADSSSSDIRYCLTANNC